MGLNKGVGESNAGYAYWTSRGPGGLRRHAESLLGWRRFVELMNNTLITAEVHFIYISQPSRGLSIVARIGRILHSRER